MDFVLWSLIFCFSNVHLTFLASIIRYYDRGSAINAIRYISGSKSGSTGCKLDGRAIRVDLDVGFTKSRQYGRGPSGRQVYSLFSFSVVLIAFLLNIFLIFPLVIIF